MEVKYTVDQLIAALESKGYPAFIKGDYNINTVGIRSANKQAGKFDDKIAVFYKAASQWKLFVYKATTDPGSKYLLNPLNPEGCAIMAEGFHKGAYTIGLHKGIVALKQIGTIKVYRDFDKDGALDFTKLTDAGPDCAINIHYSSGEAIENIGGWSAGCQVLAYGPSSNTYRQFITHYRKATSLYPNRFSYALINANDIK
jgi:hypothetical protein